MRKIAQVVRRYGPVGGMEKYVWELTRELARRGHPVLVVCERKMCEDFPGITVHETGAIRQRPRWLSLLRFSNRVEAYFADHPGYLIHSHERLGIHHVTTFHGPPFATIFEKPWHRRLSLRVWMQLWLEKRELLSAALVVPNSPLIREMLGKYYPEAKQTDPVPPGVEPGKIRPGHPVPVNGGVVGFVGREWKRKNLEMALEIVARLSKRRPELKLLIYGPDPSEIDSLVSKRGFDLECRGWKDPDYAEMDLLLHPAKAEPYGMVVAEALAARVPVVISDHCGIATYLDGDSGEVLGLEQGEEEWAQACERQLSREVFPASFSRSWGEVADEYERIYLELEGS